MTRFLVDDYAAIRRAMRDRRPADPRVGPSGPGWCPEEMREDAERVEAALGVPVSWCRNPARFGWGRAGPSWWCSAIITYWPGCPAFPFPRRLSSWHVTGWQASATDQGDVDEWFETLDAALDVLRADPDLRRRLGLP